uniref:Uncharacterized protein n=1 Tax=Anguilla anguilla TaxID=7936 RepID=A0A0E9P696_ANGAN
MHLILIFPPSNTYILSFRSLRLYFGCIFSITQGPIQTGNGSHSPSWHLTFLSSLSL